MGQATYEIVSRNEGWNIAHGGDVSGSYLTKEAAFEAAVLEASHAIRAGHAVTLRVEGAKVGKASPNKA